MTIIFGGTFPFELVLGDGEAFTETEELALLGGVLQEGVELAELLVEDAPAFHGAIVRLGHDCLKDIERLNGRSRPCKSRNE